ncbi:MAG: long-chain fatty acid--CoA ligase, partial [Candidatus Omnitrophica bacterium]|nr:long-chain fatty acid--CoA ligase [Candidatus Omnitrophota bacterium]
MSAIHFFSPQLKNENLPTMFIDCAEGSLTKVALRYKQAGQWLDISYADFLQNVFRLSTALRQRGVKKGHRVIILSENRPEWFCADLAALALGAITVPLYATSSPKECSYIIQDCEGDTLFISTQEQFNRLGEELALCRKLRHIISFDDFSNDKIESIAAIVKGMNINEEEIKKWKEEAGKIKPEDLATFIYTSGTTGTPKGVMLTHHNLMSNCVAASRAISIDRNDTLLSILPLSHVFERLAGFYLQLYTGTTVAFAENMKTAAQNLLEIKPTVMDAVPRFFEKLHENIYTEINRRGVLAKLLFSLGIRMGRKVSQRICSGETVPAYLKFLEHLFDALIFQKIRQKLGGRVRFFISGGAPLSKDLAEFFHAMGILILEGYGLTETSPVISVNRENRFRFGTVGIPIDGVDVKIAQDGEICVRGPNVMKGYYKNEEATRQVIQNGWFCTGDIGYLDADGFLHITDRKKDLIKTSGGKFVSPQLVERCLVSTDWVAQAFVFGDQRKFVVALVVPDFSLLEAYAKEHGIADTSRGNIVHHPQIVKCMDEKIQNAQKDLAEYERVKYFSIL